MAGGSVDFPVPVEVAFAYLVDPVNRPEWQSSLRRVEVLDAGEPRVGQRWRDHTVVGMVPDMRTTVLEASRRWAEVGTWRGISAELTLEFVPTPGGCRVDVHFEVTGRGPLKPVGWLATVGGRAPVLADVRRAATLLGARS